MTPEELEILHKNSHTLSRYLDYLVDGQDFAIFFPRTVYLYVKENEVDIHVRKHTLGSKRPYGLPDYLIMTIGNTEPYDRVRTKTMLVCKNGKLMIETLVGHFSRRFGKYLSKGTRIPLNDVTDIHDAIQYLDGVNKRQVLSITDFDFHFLDGEKNVTVQ